MDYDIHVNKPYDIRLMSYTLAMPFLIVRFQISVKKRHRVKKSIASKKGMPGL